MDRANQVLKQHDRLFELGRKKNLFHVVASEGLMGILLAMGAVAPLALLRNL